MGNAEYMGHQFSINLEVGTMKVLAALVVLAVLILGEMSTNAYFLNRRSYDIMQHEPENFRQKRLAMTLKDAELIKDMLVAEKLASSIMTDVQSVLREFRKEDNSASDFWADMHENLADMDLDKPKDPKRLLRLS